MATCMSAALMNKDESDLRVSSLNIWSKYRHLFFFIFASSSSQREARFVSFLPSRIAVLKKNKTKKKKQPQPNVSKCVSVSSTWRHPWSASTTRDNSRIVLKRGIRFLSIAGFHPATLVRALLSSPCLSPPTDGLISLICFRSVRERSRSEYSQSFLPLLN